MSAPSVAIPADTDAVEGASPRSFWRTVRTTPEGRVGLAIGVLALVVIVFGPYLAPFGPSELATGPALERPSRDHLLGTDQLGRDVLSRFLYGGRTVLLAPLAAVTLSFLLGGTLGLFGAYRQGRADAVITRGFDLLITLPALLIALVLITGVGTSWTTVVVVVALVFTPRVGRVVRGAAQGVVSNDYILAAQARGERTRWILGRELLPNAVGPIIANYCLFLTYGIIFVSTLSFLGLGARPPSSEWGLMVADSRALITANPWPTLAPTVGIAALSISFTLLGAAAARHLTRESASGSVPL